jgi:hypothetical protein
LLLPLPLWLSSPKGICFLSLPLFVSALILSTAKDPDTLHAPHIARTFQPRPFSRPGQTAVVRPCRCFCLPFPDPPSCQPPHPPNQNKTKQIEMSERIPPTCYT